ncbi:hypothetical protein [Cohnella silvisoli]|uniref:Uncharacterized protein n=1 Tax=Cohnella silvisoli TaxID=2873699 RepID=A0ABV1KYN1_9BACL|nr:hypothetical protein [Cohnella silvisoli]MCD9024358.1 hypothetical protein [Cohnella silvisoli]
MLRILTKIKRINRASERSIGKFMKTANTLEKQNAQLDGALSAIDVKIAELNELKIAAAFRKDENVGIIGRIGRVIRG